MKLKKIHLSNYRCYERCELDFHENLTVLIAPNGMGKTAILDAIAQGFGPLYRGFPGIKTTVLSNTDIRVIEREKQAALCIVSFAAEHEKKNFFWGIQRKLNAGISAAMMREASIAATQIAPAGYFDKPANERVTPQTFNKQILASFNEEKPFELPLVVYYGTERAVRSEVKRRRNFKKAFSRFDALAGALDASATFRSALEWFNAMEEQERRDKIARRDYRYRREDLEAVRSAICALLPAKHSNPRVEMRPLRFVIDHKGKFGKSKTLRLSQMSDGYRIILALVMDLARRMVEANPQPVGKSPFSVPSIVLIDEIDLHLHPEWQQTILTDLRRVFPKTQFIVTTHSPQVLTTVPPECLRRISFGADGVRIETGFQFLLGARADQVLEEVLGVSARPEALPEVKDLRRYKELVSENLWDNEEALKLRTKLNAWGRGYEHELEKIDVDIKVRNFRRDNSRSK